jgi:predicted nucleotide-binding protein
LLAQRWSDHYIEALHLKIPALVGYIDQLKAMSPPEESTSQEPLAVNESSKKIFIVHGHDSAALDQLELILHRRDLDPFILQNTAGGGLTIIEVLEKEIGPRDGAARFGIVLLTPDDTGTPILKARGLRSPEPDKMSCWKWACSSRHLGGPMSRF